MATKTVGTAATTTLTAVQMAGISSAGLPSDADWATICQSILDDFNIAHPIWPGALARKGMLYIPNRGVLRIHQNDWIAVDPCGMPFLIPSYSLPTTLAATGTATSGSPANVFTSSVIALGWQVGMAITGTNIPASTVISNISSDGLTVTMSKNATGSGANTVTVGQGWTHS